MRTLRHTVARVVPLCQQQRPAPAIKTSRFPCSYFPVLVVVVPRHFSVMAPAGSSAADQNKALFMDALKDLRSRSGAPIAECKKALQATDNDLPAAQDWLREHGAAKTVAKVGDRATSQGLVGLHIAADGQSAALALVASETDFAGRSEQFVRLVHQVSQSTLVQSRTTNGTLDAHDILACTLDNGKSLKDILDEAIVAIRENLIVAQATRWQTQSHDAMLVGYVHNRVADSGNGGEAGTAAALVELAPASGNSIDAAILHQVGKKLAMHIVAAKPRYLATDNVPAHEMEKEAAMLRRQNEDLNKPEDIVEKIVQGRLRKYYEQVCLLEQAHMIENKNPKVSTVLKTAHVQVTRFANLAIGS